MYRKNVIYHNGCIDSKKCLENGCGVPFPETKDSMKYDREESEQLEGPKDSTEMKVVIKGAEWLEGSVVYLDGRKWLIPWSFLEWKGACKLVCDWRR